MTRLRGFDSVFELLRTEKQEIFKDYFRNLQNSNFNLPVSHEWQLGELQRSMIKTDDPFVSNDAVWKLGLTYNQQKDATLNVNINLVINPFPSKSSKMYFKKNEFFLQSNHTVVGDQMHVQLLPNDFDERSLEE